MSAKLSEPTVGVQLPGGMGSLETPVTLALAALWLQPEPDNPEHYGWEVREPGVDPEETWEAPENPYATLRAAVDAALPCWQVIGISYPQAAVLAMDAGLVLSTGVSLDEDDAD